MIISEHNEYKVEIAEDLGSALRYFRTAASVSQKTAAEWDGVSQPYLSSLESGKFGSSLQNALRILRLLGCEVIVRRREPRG
jgi:predicted transcriptional regulator